MGSVLSSGRVCVLSVPRSVHLSHRSFSRESLCSRRLGARSGRRPARCVSRGPRRALFPEGFWGPRRRLGDRAPRGADAAPCFQLAPDDAWRCPHCKQLQQGSITLSLWTLPDVLIVHLKRFRQVRAQSPGRSPAPCC